MGKENEESKMVSRLNYYQLETYGKPNKIDYSRLETYGKKPSLKERVKKALTKGEGTPKKSKSEWIKEKFERGIKGKQERTKEYARAKQYESAKGLFENKSIKYARASTRRRAKAARGILGVMGITGTSKGAVGRPRGTYKYGVPIHLYKKEMAQRRNVYERYQQSMSMRLAQRGISPQRLQQLQEQRTVEQIQEPQYQQQIQQQSTFKGDIPEQIVNDELEFERWNAKNNLSPSAERLLMRLHRVQNKGKMDNIRQQRIHEERRIIRAKSSLFQAHKNMTKVTMDFTGVSQNNILMAPNVFKELPENRIMKSNRPNILQTRETGNNIQL